MMETRPEDMRPIVHRSSPCHSNCEQVAFKRTIAQLEKKLAESVPISKLEAFIMENKESLINYKGDLEWVIPEGDFIELIEQHKGE